MKKELDFKREKSFDIFFGKRYIFTLTIDYYEPITKASALLSANGFLENNGETSIPFTRLNILKTHIKRTA